MCNSTRKNHPGSTASSCSFLGLSKDRSILSSETQALLARVEVIDHRRISQVQQYGSPYDPYGSCSPRLQSTAYTSTSATGAANAGNPGGLHQEATAVYVTGDALPPLASSSSSSLSTTTASYTRYEVVPSSYATTHAIRSSSSSSKVLTVDLPSPDSGIGADAVTPRQDHHPPTALHQVSGETTVLPVRYARLNPLFEPTFHLLSSTHY